MKLLVLKNYYILGTSCPENECVYLHYLRPYEEFNILKNYGVSENGWYYVITIKKT